jgi:hypothetical protein
MGYDGVAVSDPRLDDLWQAVLAKWEDDAAHAAFLEHCRLTQQLGVAAARYREEVSRASAYREDTVRVETAKKRLGAVALLATLDLDASRGASAPRAHRVVKTVSWVAAAVLFGISMFVVLRFIAR